MDFQASDLPLSGADNHCVFWSKSLSIFQNCSQSHLPKSVLLFFSNKNIVLALFQRFTAFREHISIRQTNIPCQACLRISLGCSFNFPVLLLAFGARSHLPLCPSCLSTLLFPALTTVEGMGTIPQLPFHPCVMLQVPSPGLPPHGGHFSTIGTNLVLSQSRCSRGLWSTGDLLGNTQCSDSALSLPQIPLGPAVLARREGRITCTF